MAALFSLDADQPKSDSCFKPQQSFWPSLPSSAVCNFMLPADLGPIISGTSFPPEVLGEVFLASIPALGSLEDPRAHFPWPLSHVCAHWRASALSYPKLWSFLDLKQTDLNDQRTSPALDFLEAYLQRSSDHPLTFRLAYSYHDAICVHPFLECLLQHSARWETVHLDAAKDQIMRSLIFGAGRYPIMRSLSFSRCFINTDRSADLDFIQSFPLSQLKSYHEYLTMWYPESGDQWSVLEQLTSVVDLRTKICAPRRGSGSPIAMPYLRVASLALRQPSLLDSFNFPHLEGLNLKLLTNYGQSVPCPVPGGLRHLKVLRLCGTLKLSNDALTCILTEIPTLRDFSLEMYGMDIDALHLFTLLAQPVLALNLQALRLTEFSCADAVVSVFLGMLQARFGGAEAEGPEFMRLRLFTLRMGPRNKAASLSASLHTLKERERWDIRVDEGWMGEDLWREEIDTAFL